MNYGLFGEDDLVRAGEIPAIVLRDYQQKALAAVLAAKDRGLNRVMVVMATGCGKTTVFAALVDEFERAYGAPSLVLAHRHELLTQAAARVASFSPRLQVGIEGGDRNAPFECQVVVAGVQSVGRPETKRLDWFHPGLMIIDEGHHTPADSYQIAMRRFGSYDGSCFTLGVTATDHRMDNKPLHGEAGAIFEDVVFRFGLRDAVREGWLVDLKGYRVATDVDLSSIKSLGGDYNQSQLARAVNTQERNYTAYRHWREVAGDRRTIVFCVDVQHAKDVAELFRSHHIDAEHVDGTMKMDQREGILRRFNSGRTQVLTNVDVCLDAATEILTDEGWTGMDEMTDAHQVANWHDGRVWFEPPRRVVRRDRAPDERMVVLETKNRSLRVTENHRMLYRTFHEGNFLKKTAAEIVDKQCELPISGHAEPSRFEIAASELSPKDTGRLVRASSYTYRRQGMEPEAARSLAEERIARRYAMRAKVPDELTEDECRLIGFWLGDGTRTLLSSGGVEYVMTQSTAYPFIIGWVDGLLARLELNVAKRTKPPGSYGTLPVIAWSLCRGTGFGSQERSGVFHLEPYLDKGGTSLLWGLNGDQFAALVEGLWMADGIHGSGEREKDAPLRITGTNHRLFSLLQAIGVCRGYRANITEGANHKANPAYAPIYYLSLRRETSHRMTKHRLAFEEDRREERVWCVETSSGNIVTRRRGTVTVMGNCTEGFDAPATDCVLLLRPTQSWSLYAQMLGRGLRTLGGTVDGVEEAKRRRQAIADSPKGDCIVIDVVDASKEFGLSAPPENDAEEAPKEKPKGENASLAGLVGLPPEFDLQGNSLFAAAERVEELEPARKGALFRRQTNWDDLSTVLSEVDLIKELSIPEEIVGVSGLAWMKVGDGQYWLPCGDGSMEKNRAATIATDELGRMTVELRSSTMPPMQVPLGDELQRAFDEADRLIRMTWSDAGRIVKADARWREKPPSDHQREVLRSLGVEEREIELLETMHQARSLIERRRIGLRGRLR